MRLKSSYFICLAAYSRKSLEGHQDLLGKPRHFRFKLFNSFHDNRSRSPTLQSSFDQTVRMRMIPIKPRRFVPWKRNVIPKSLARINDRVNYLVLAAIGRSVCAVIMEVDRRSGHRDRHMRLVREVTITGVAGVLFVKLIIRWSPG